MIVIITGIGKKELPKVDIELSSNLYIFPSELADNVCQLQGVKNKIFCILQSKNKIFAYH